MKPNEYHILHYTILHFIIIIIIVAMRPSILATSLAILFLVLATIITTTYALPIRTMDPTTPPAAPQDHSSPSTTANTTHWWYRVGISVGTVMLILFDVCSALALCVLYVRSRDYYGTSTFAFY